MSRPFAPIGFPLLVALAACAAPPPVRVAAPKPGPVVPAEMSMTEDEVVALLNGRPVTRREVADHALAADGKNLIDQYIRWKVRTDRVRELGIVNTPEELKARARAILDTFRRTEGEEAYRKQLEEAGLTEDQYVDRFTATPGFPDRLSLEKAFCHDLLVEGSVLFDAMAFESEDEAKAFVELTRTCPTFDDAAAVALQRESRVARWPRYRVSRELTIESLSKSPEVGTALFGLKAGEVSGVEKTASGFFLVLRCVASDPPAPGTYADHRERAAAEALSAGDGRPAARVARPAHQGLPDRVQGFLPSREMSNEV